jgi:pimeloyl-ACP methyl ester carboxylesterase
MPTYPSISRAYTRCRHGQMHYRVAGPLDSAKVPVVLLHQNPSSGYEYEALIDALAQDRRILAFDTPGYGMSDAPPSPPGMAGYAAAFSDALDALEADGLLSGPVDIYGFHTGTLLCSELAIARPDRVRRLALTGIPMFSAEESAKKLDEALNYPLPEESGEPTLTLLRNLWNYVVASRDPAVPLQKAVFNFADKARVLDRFTWAYQGVWSWDYSRLRLVAQPALLLQPAEDLLELAKAAAALMPNCTIVEMLDLDRDIFDVAPERIANELRRFFDRV